jgi:hypothetical protein
MTIVMDIVYSDLAENLPKSIQKVSHRDRFLNFGRFAFKISIKSIEKYVIDL